MSSILSTAKPHIGVIELIIQKKCSAFNAFHNSWEELGTKNSHQFEQFSQHQQQNMSIEISKPQQSDRNRRLAALRSSAQQISLIGTKTNLIHSKFQGLMKMAITEAVEVDFGLSEARSMEGGSSEEEEVQIENSFKEKYDLLEKLGEGGNACVYKCQYKKTGKLYAVKKFRLEEEHILQLKKCYVNFQSLNHPSVIKYRALYFDQDQRSAFLVMDYVEHKSLEDFQAKDQEELRHIVKELVTAIGYIHNQNICHRDIKPQNILYDPKERKIKIIDFGISKKTFQRGNRRDMLTIIGTQFYLAPEVYIGGGYDERVDLWALGVTIYKLVAGYTPFQSEYHSSTVTNILKGELKFQDKIWMRYSPFLKDFVSRLLKDRDHRMTLRQAETHLWLQEKSHKLHKPRINRYVSQNVEPSEDFHKEIQIKVKNASSREQGEAQSQNRLYKSINLIGEEYDLQDSEDQETMVSPLYSSLSLNRHCFSDFCVDSKQI